MGINAEIGELGYTTLFWGVMAGFSWRLIAIQLMPIGPWPVVGT
jgi:hypothetical protein